jgi:uncharacterized membrane protein
METPNDPKSNPYQAPVASALPVVAASPDATYLPGGRSVSAGDGLEWILSAWKLFVEWPLIWIVMIVVYAVFYVVLAFVPIIGSLVGYVLYGVIGAGWLAGAHAVARGEKLEIEHLFAGFKSKTGPLIAIGVFYAAGLLVILLLMGVFLMVGLGASGAIGAILSGDTSQLASIAGSSIITFLLAALIGLALLAPLLAALWFAPALVYFHDVPPLEALKVSFFACMKNLLSFLVYGVLMLVLCVVASLPLLLGFLVVAWLPLLLGFLVVGPLALISAYTSYRAIFTERA